MLNSCYTRVVLYHPIHLSRLVSTLESLEWCSQEFKLFDSHNETLVRKLEQEQENVSQLMKESESIKLLRERSAGDNIFDAERQVFSKNSDGTIKKSVIKETCARVTLRPKRKSVDDESLKEISGSVFCFHSRGTIGWISHHLRW